jgi:hypothetical protein
MDVTHLKDKISYMFKMEEKTVTLPQPPEGYEYKLVSTKKKPRVSDKDPSELTPRQLATRKYYEKNRLKLNEENLKRYHEKKKENLSTFGDTR